MGNISEAQHEVIAVYNNVIHLEIQTGSTSSLEDISINL